MNKSRYTDEVPQRSVAFPLAGRYFAMFACAVNSRVCAAGGMPADPSSVVPHCTQAASCQW